MAASGERKPTIFPYGIADSVAALVCLAAPDRQILALGLEDGEERWRSREAERPLAFADDRVACLRIEGPRTARVVALDLEDGSLLTRSEPMTFPSGVVCSTYDRDEFRIEALTSNGTALITWRARVGYRGGAPPALERTALGTTGLGGPGPVERGQSVQEMEGSARVDLSTGKLEQRPFVETRFPQAERRTVGAEATFLVRDRALSVRHEHREPGSGGPATRSTWLEAREVGSGDLLWRRLIDSREMTPPKALRMGPPMSRIKK